MKEAILALVITAAICLGIAVVAAAFADKGPTGIPDRPTIPEHTVTNTS